MASRRKSEEFIIQGRVKVNGKIVTEIGTKIDDEKDIVEFDNKKIEVDNKDHIYVLLNKPIGYVTTAKDQFGRDTVMDLVKVGKRIVPVGRLDMYTSGALILTDDGDFVYKITHPKYEITKTYAVTLKGIIKKEEISQLEEGVIIDENYKTRPANVKILKIDKENNQSRILITIHEGKNRQVRKMCNAINKKVLALHRSKIGNIDVKNIELGKWRYLTKNEVKELIGIK